MKKILLILVFCLFYSNLVYGQEIQDAKHFLSENQIIVPDDIEELCIYYGEKHSIAPELLEAIIWKESRFIHTAQNSTNSCKGLMQINIYSHSERMKRLGIRNIFNKAENIAVGSDYLEELLQENNLEIALMLYNGDKKAYKKDYISKYVKNILEVTAALECVNEKK